MTRDSDSDSTHMTRNSGLGLGLDTGDSESESDSRFEDSTTSLLLTSLNTVVTSEIRTVFFPSKRLSIPIFFSKSQLVVPLSFVNFLFWRYLLKCLLSFGNLTLQLLLFNICLSKCLFFHNTLAKQVSLFIHECERIQEKLAKLSTKLLSLARDDNEIGVLLRGGERKSAVPEVPIRIHQALAIGSFRNVSYQE